MPAPAEYSALRSLVLLMRLAHRKGSAVAALL